MTGTQLKILALIVLALFVVSCEPKHASGIPKDILGVSIGMDKDEAQKHLQELAEFDRNERNDQEVWIPKDKSRFNALAIGYTREKRVRYVTAFADKKQTKERIPFSSFGDLTTAKVEIMQPHYHYIWDVPATDDSPAYMVKLYGDNPEFITIYSLVNKIQPGEIDHEDEGSE